ncbi:unnamed protein product [Effrenium voratum]|nr:unnamed protein product [Effrenium voratum]
MPSAVKGILTKFEAWLEDTFGGTGDPEQPDAVEICNSECDYLATNFDQDRAELKAIFEGVKTRLEKVDPSFQFSRRAAETTVPAVPSPNETVELFLNPWHLSFDPALSLKGKSKMVHVLRCVRDFLEKPYNSIENPIHVTFPKSIHVEGGALQDFMVGHGIGFAKSLAMKILLLGVNHLELSDDELKALSPQVKALYGFRCTYKTAGQERQDRFACLQDKFAESARPRPDCIQVSNLLLVQARADGMDWAEAAPKLVAEFNSSSENEVKQLTDMEISIVKTLPLLDADTFQAIDYHWQTNLIRNSALPYKVLAADAFFNGLKPKTNQDSELWRNILAVDNRKRHWYVKRKVQYFLFKVADAKRLKKKVNLSLGASSFRDQKDGETAWTIAAIFSHFLGEWQHLLTDKAVARLQERFCRGYLDTELAEKHRMMNPKLTAVQFRFLADVGFQGALDPECKDDMEAKANSDLEKAELARAKARLAKEQSYWETFQAKLKLQGLGLQQEQLDKERQGQRKAIERYADTFLPLRDVSHGGTFSEAAINKFCNDQGLPMDPVYKVYWCNCTVLGYDAQAGMQAAVKEYAAQIASSPETSCMLVAAPNCGAWGNEYNEAATIEATNQTRQILADPDYRLLVREVHLAFDPASIQMQSKRPGLHKFFMCISDQSSGDKVLSHFAQSLLWKRQIVPGAIKDAASVPMLAVKNMVDPRRSFATCGGNLDLSKPARRKQWLSGWAIPAAFHDALWASMSLPKKAVAAWLDVFAFDHSLAECLMRKADYAGAPRQLYIGLIWAEMNTRELNPGESTFKANARVCKWLNNQIRRKLQACCTDGLLKVPDWAPLSNYSEGRTAPALQDSDFTMTYPAASNLLPLRATCLELMESKLQSPESRAEWEAAVVEHNVKWNPSGQPHLEGTKRRAESDGGGPRKKAKVVDKVPGQPETLEELIAKKGAVAEVSVEPAKVFFTDSGEIWAMAAQDCELSDQRPGLALVFGAFKLNEEIDAAEKKATVYHVNFQADTEEACFVADGDKGTGKRQSLRTYLSSLEASGRDLAIIEFACHTVKAKSEKDGAGDTTGRTCDVTVSDKCAFVPAKTPRKIGAKASPDWEDVGSVPVTAQGASWDPVTKKHKTGLLQIVSRWSLTDTEQGIQCVPAKPMARLSDTESEDWMAEPGRPFAAATKAASKASVPKGAAFPVAAEAGAVQGKSAMAWRDWTKPKPAGSVPGPAACAQDKNPKRNKTDLEKQSAVATAVAKKGAEAAEAAVRLATLAAKQMAQSLATPQRAAPKERSVELPTVEKQTQQPPRDAVQQQQAPGSSKGEDSEKVRERSPAGKDETDGPKPKKARAAWGSVGCFAGRRPPTDDESKESFELKRKLWSESRSALEKKYPGKPMKGAVTRTASQEAYWFFLQGHMKKTLKGNGKKPGAKATKDGASAESRSSPGSSWLTPAASAGASWLQPPVTVEPKAKVPRSSSPLEVCSQQQAASGRAPSWLTPSPAGCSRPARMPAKPMPEVHLTLGMVILAGESRETAALPLAEARAATASLLAEPCRSTSSKTGVCSSCEGGFDVDEVAHVRMIFQQLKIEARSQLLSTCWSTGKDSDASRAAWRFLGKRVCLRRLTALLGCSARTFQKATHGGSVDLRQNNGRARADASISVDQFFFEMYNSAAELLPEDPSCHVEDIDNSIDADERPAASADKRNRAQAWQAHLREQYHDRLIYWHLRWQSRSPESRVLTVIIDGLDKNKGVWPQYTFRKSKALDKFNRPRIVVHLALAHGYCADFYLADDENFFHGASFFCEVLTRTLARVQRMCASRGRAMPDHLVVQADNTTAQAKNSEVVKFLAVLVLKYKFHSAVLNFLQVGHTHEDVDFMFSLLLALVLRKVRIKVPDDLRVAILTGMAPVTAGKGYELNCELMTHVRDFNSWMRPALAHCYNCFVTRRGVQSPHSFTFKLRMDLSHTELSSLQEQGLVASRVGHAHDVFVVVKHYMSSKAPNGPPVLLLPTDRFLRLASPAPTGSCYATHPMNEKRKSDLQNLAAFLENMSSAWGVEHSYFRAAQELRCLADGRDAHRSTDGYLESLQPARDQPLALTDNPYYNNLPGASWQMLVKFPMTHVKLFGLTVATLLACAHLSGAPRDLDAVEIFSGVGSIAAAAQSQGFAARPFDKYRVMGCTDVDGETSEDMTVKSGFMNAVELVFRLRLGGLLWLAPVCASWIGLNISRTRRSAANMYHGDTTYPKVAQGNVMATACAMLMELAHSRGVELVLENPPCSSIFNFPPIARVLQMLSPESCVTHRCAFDRGSPDGKKLWKKYKFVGSRQWIQHVARPCTCKSKKHIHLTKKWTDSRGKVRFQGRASLLRRSAAYPKALGVQVVKAWCAGREAAATPFAARRPTKRPSEPSAQSQPAVAPKRHTWLQPSVSSRPKSSSQAQPNVAGD